MSAEDGDSPHEILVYGCAYTPHYDTEDDTTTLFKNSEMTSDFAASVKGLPVYIEHDTRHRIGDVHDAHINERRQLMTLLRIHGNSVVNGILPGTLGADPVTGKRYYNALSLGNDVDFCRDDSGLRIVQNVPSEISLVLAGNRPMTEISDYWLVPRNTDVNDFISTHPELTQKLSPFY